jgi:ribosomal protein L36
LGTVAVFIRPSGTLIDKTDLGVMAVGGRIIGRYGRLAGICNKRHQHKAKTQGKKKYDKRSFHSYSSTTLLI